MVVLIFVLLYSSLSHGTRTYSQFFSLNISKNHQELYQMMTNLWFVYDSLSESFKDRLSNPPDNQKCGIIFLIRLRSYPHRMN